MLDISLIGTGGMAPLPERHLSSCLFRYDGTSFLIDVGEGTQIGIKELGMSLKKIDYILFTHYHTDHISGLPGLLATLANNEKRDRLTLIGPKGLERTVNAAKRMVSKLPYEVQTIELMNCDETLKLGGLHVTPFPVQHGIVCLGYRIELRRECKCDPEKAKKNGVPMEFWSDLQNYKTIEYNGRILTKDLISSGPRKGISFVYVTDTRPCESIYSNAKDVDLLICEGMYGNTSQLNSSNQKLHMTMQEAAQIASSCRVGELILTHFSPRIQNPEIFRDELLAIYPNTVIGKDGIKRELVYPD